MKCQTVARPHRHDAELHRRISNECAADFVHGSVAAYCHNGICSIGNSLHSQFVSMSGPLRLDDIHAVVVSRKGFLYDLGNLVLRLTSGNRIDNDNNLSHYFIRHAHVLRVNRGKDNKFFRNKLLFLFFYDKNLPDFRFFTIFAVSNHNYKCHFYKIN